MRYEKRSGLIFGMFLLMGVFLIFIIPNQNVSAIGEAIVCCEQTTSGAWCQEVVDVNECETGGNLRSAPTSCESTSYCKVGTCVNTLDGLCMENTAQKVCENPVGGAVIGQWYEREIEEVPQCQLGCCLVGDQAAFTTQARCKQISSDFGLETNYRTDINTESQCINSASPKVKGACVFEEEAQRTCRFITKQECNNLENTGFNAEFTPGFLCSAEELGTNCGPSKKTMLVEGRDEVFYQDTCGNPANIYDSAQQDDLEYWKEIIPKSLSCSLNSNLNNANVCGNCNYIDGSIGTEYQRSFGTAPVFGDYICKDLSCGEVDGEDREHGESWCVSSAGIDEKKSDSFAPLGQDEVPDLEDDLNFAPGSRHFRRVCYNGEVTLEPCADFRGERCIEDSINSNNNEVFSTAACRVNIWQDCIAQDDERNCINSDRRDCKWIPGERFDDIVDKVNLERNGRCVPLYAPGFNFWEDGEATTLCAQATNDCIVKFEKGLSGGLGEFVSGIGEATDFLGQSDTAATEYVCVENCHCLGLKAFDYNEDSPTSPPENTRLDNRELDNDWVNDENRNICIALGDCGIYTNFVDEQGYLEIDDVVVERKADDGSSDSGGILGL